MSRIIFPSAPAKEAVNVSVCDREVTYCIKRDGNACGRVKLLVAEGGQG